MRTLVRKGNTYLNVIYSNNDFSNNLYCSDIYLENGIIELNFHNIKNSRVKTNSASDLEDLMENYDKIIKNAFCRC